MRGRRAVSQLSFLASHLLRFFLPWACAGCRTPLSCLEDEGFCGTCWLNLPRIQGLVCQACGIPLPEGGRWCYVCQRFPPALRVRAATVYQGAVAKAMYRFKYLGRKSLSVPFGVLLSQAFRCHADLGATVGLVPVPLFERQERLRGFNQADLLAQELGRHIGRPVLRLLEKMRKTVSQTTLDRAHRQTNVHEAFALDPVAQALRARLKGMPLLLIDDVCTTTSTLQACASTLRKAGIGPISGLVLARDL